MCRVLLHYLDCVYHTSCQCSTEVLDKLRAWAADKVGVTVVAGRWQDVLPSLGCFDRVFFDDYPLEEAEDEGAITVQTPGAFIWSRWHSFLDVLLAGHVPVGGIVTGYLARDDLMLQRPDCVTKLSPLSVEVPADCR